MVLSPASRQSFCPQLSEQTMALVRRDFPGLDVYALKGEYDAWLADGEDAGSPPIIRGVFTASSVRSTRAIMADPTAFLMSRILGTDERLAGAFQGLSTRRTRGRMGNASGHWERCRDIGNKLSGHQEQAFGTSGTNYRDIGNARNF